MASTARTTFYSRNRQLKNNMAVVPHRNPFEEVYHQTNQPLPQLQTSHSGSSSAKASMAANDSSASLVDPMLRQDPRSEGGQPSVENMSGHTSERLRALEQSAARQAGRKPTKSLAPIRIPRRSESSQHQQQDPTRSPATQLSSAALTSSFPLPPPRTPASSSPAGTFGSPAPSRHDHSQEGCASGGSGTGSNSPRDSSYRHSPLKHTSTIMPRKILSVPPPTPAFNNSSASSSLGLYWEGETSVIRNSGSHPAPSAILPYYSPDPAAFVHTPMHEEPYTRVKSFAAEYSTHLPSAPASPSYPPRAYSPAGSSEVSRHGFGQTEGSPSQHGGEAYLRSPANQASRPLLLRSHSEDPNYRRQRRDSAGTFGTAVSSSPSTGLGRAIHTLENEDFASTGTRTTTHTRTHSEVSMTSSPGMTHELVRRGNVFEALPSGMQDASRRLARASLVSSQLLRSAHSADALRSELAEDPSFAVDKEYDETNSRQLIRTRHSHRYSSGPAPTLASLAEDDDDRYLPPSGMDARQDKHTSRHKSRKKRPYGHLPRQNSDWANKSSKSYSSARSGKSSAQFTVASQAPSLPTLRNPNVRAEIEVRESTIPFKKLAKRASTLGDILDNLPEHGPYVGYPAADGSRDPSYDEINELRYSNQLRKARRKIEVGIPDLWSSHTPMGSASTGIKGKEYGNESEDMQEIHASRGKHELDERHFRRRKSYPASQLQEAISVYTEKPNASGAFVRSSFSSSGSREEDEGHASVPMKTMSYWQTLPPQKKKKVRLAVIFAIGLLIAAIIGAAIPLSKRSGDKDGAECERTCSGQSKAVLRDGVCACQCSGNRAGPFCDLDTTCVCPDGSPECPNRLAKSLVSASSYASTLFAPPINTTRLAARLATLQTGGGDCSSQLSLLETPNLDPLQYKARRRWTQAVFLWNAATSEDFSSRVLYDFQAGLSYWQWQDSPSFQAQPSFQIEAHGYSIDFAYQRVFVKPKDLDDLGISETEAARLSNVSASALQRMGAFAQAASTQRSSALSRLFETLGYTTFQLATFRSTVLASPVYFPFDVGRSLGSQSTMAVAQQHKQTSAGFPIPPACLPGLSADQLTQLNQAEDIFGLPVTSTVSEVHANCTDRPVYGILNILNMRLPFMDNQISLQAAVVTNQDRKEVMTFSSGPTLIPLSYAGDANTSVLTTASFGISTALDNVLFDYFSQLDVNTSLARAVIDYILSGNKAPPSSTSPLGNLSHGLTSLPVIEVQAWGGIFFSDIDYIASGLSRGDSGVLFGSDTGADLRNWAHSGESSKPIRWSLEAMSGQYALDNGGNSAFQDIWESSRTSTPDAIFASLGSSNLLTS